jgi:hypothetical protein
VNYQDELNELDEEIRQELRQQSSASPRQPRQFSDSSELLTFLRSASVRKDVKTLTFSSCVRRLRTRVGVSAGDLAVAMDIPSEALDQLESNESVPWTQPPPVIANVAYAFRLHFSAVENLTRNSFTIASVSGRISDSSATASQISSWLAEVRSNLEIRGANDLVDC